MLLSQPGSGRKRRRAGGGPGAPCSPGPLRSSTASCTPTREAQPRDAHRGLPVQRAPRGRQRRSQGPGAQAGERGRQWGTPRRGPNRPSPRRLRGSGRRRQRRVPGLGDFGQLCAFQGCPSEDPAQRPGVHAAPRSLLPVPPPADDPEPGRSCHCPGAFQGCDVGVLAPGGANAPGPAPPAAPGPSPGTSAAGS